MSACPWQDKKSLNIFRFQRDFRVVRVRIQTMKHQFTQDLVKDQILKFQIQKSRLLAGIRRLFANAILLGSQSNTL